MLLPIDDLRTFSWTSMGRYPFPPALCRGFAGTLNDGKEPWPSLSALCCYCCSVAKPCPTLCNPMDCSTPGSPVLYYLPDSKGFFPASGFFSNESALCIRWPEYWSFSPSNEYSGLNSFRIDWFDLLAVQGTFKSLLQHYSLKASILRHSAFFMVQFLHA